MKILISIILTAISTSLYAQITMFGKEFKKGEVVKNEQKDKFQGKYVWKKGTDNFTLILKKDTMKKDSDNPFELLIGTYDYTKQGKVVYLNTNNPIKHGNLAGGLEVLDERLTIYFKDGTTGANAKGYLAFNNDGKLIWKIAQHDDPGIRFIGHRKDLSVPTEMILEKIPN
ncbi:hypothetical protein IWX76_001044 [Pedobacter sp. CAN_A7]|uniref:DUF6705 family protein n=1 Tax=Pedobacter sp. CAN_A7 TaxID=2787722 RepID=UPI0018CA8006